MSDPLTKGNNSSDHDKEMLFLLVFVVLGGAALAALFYWLAK